MCENILMNFYIFLSCSKFPFLFSISEKSQGQQRKEEEAGRGIGQRGQRGGRRWRGRGAVRAGSWSSETLSEEHSIQEGEEEVIGGNHFCNWSGLIGKLRLISKIKGAVIF